MAGTELDFSELIIERTADFTGREWVFEKLDDWLTAGAPGVLLLTAGPGAGKSTFIVQLAADHPD